MKNRSGIGPGAVSLILMILIVALGILAMLTLVTARQDSRLTDRSMEMTQVYYDLSAAAERHYAELDAMIATARKNGQNLTEVDLPEGMYLEGDLVRWSEEYSQNDGNGGKCLVCTVQILQDESGPRLKWIQRVYGQAETD